MNIALIGAGELGSRHLQAMSRSSKPYEIDVIDPSTQSRTVAEARLLEMGETPVSVAFLDDIPSGKNYEVVIVATSSLVRASVTQRLLDRAQVKHIVFEKILFPSIEEYDDIDVLLEKHSVKAWVNCPRRMYPIFEQLKPLFTTSPLTLSITGGDWGLGCNGVHIIDLVAHLTGETEFDFSPERLDPIIHESKRAGYIEFTGTLMGATPTGASLSLTSLQDNFSPCVIHIAGSDASVVLDEGNGVGLLYSKKTGWKPEQLSFRLPYQSELTHLVIDSLIDRGGCPLTTFSESCALHKPMLKAFLEHQKACGVDSDICPIT